MKAKARPTRRGRRGRQKQFGHTVDNSAIKGKDGIGGSGTKPIIIRGLSRERTFSLVACWFHIYRNEKGKKTNTACVRSNRVGSYSGCIILDFRHLLPP